MRGLSIKQPWVNMILKGDKTIETRTWQTKYRGPILICASQSPKIEPYGKAVALAILSDCRPMTALDEPLACCQLYERANSWILNDVTPIEPFSFKGNLRLFNLESDIWRKIRIGAKSNEAHSRFDLSKWRERSER